MSYILEALKKAEAERRQDALPGLHTQPLPPASEPRPLWSQPVVWSATSACAAILLGIIWWQPWQTSPLASIPATTTPAPEIASEPLPPQAATSIQPLQPPAAIDAPPPAKTRPILAQPKEAKPKPPKKAQAAKPVPRQTAAPVAVAQALPPEEPIATLRELPQHVQHKIPALRVEGYIYAEKPSGRSVLINRRLLREGDQVAPDLILEKMTPNGIVLSYKGYRFRTSY